jgi:hypothetical protein
LPERRNAYVHSPNEKLVAILPNRSRGDGPSMPGGKDTVSMILPLPLTVTHPLDAFVSDAALWRAS